ncbi:MAG: YraN family protein [Rhodospirillales bacterium]
MTPSSRQEPSQGGPRQRAERYGRAAEALAALLLRLKGYTILARDLRTPWGEIDLIARRRHTLAFVEVKARREMTEEVLTRRQRRRIVFAAEAFLARRPELTGLCVRFDVILIGGGRRPRHLTDAFRADDD